MINNEIIEALEYIRYHLTASKHKEVIDDAIDVINRQQAEIERYKKHCSKCGEKTTKTILQLQEIIADKQAEIERLLKIAKKMHTWIFLNSYDEDEAYKECGLTDEENAMLGYGGKIILEDKEMVGDTE